MIKKDKLEPDRALRGATLPGNTASHSVQEWAPMDEYQTKEYFDRSHLFLFILTRGNPRELSPSVKLRVAEFLDTSLDDLNFSHMEDDFWMVQLKDYSRH
jgi:hypothetical protein